MERFHRRRECQLYSYRYAGDFSEGSLHTLERVSQQIRKSSTLPLEVTASAADGQRVPEFLPREAVQ
jgi:hypothetical protein